MGIKSIVQVAVTLAILAVSTGKLPLILKEVRKAQFVLLEESKALRWQRKLLAREGAFIRERVLRLSRKILE
jgi:hypothetical protein